MLNFYSERAKQARTILFLSVLVVATWLLTACGSSGGGGSPPANNNPPTPTPAADEEPGGVWAGTITSTTAGDTYDLLGVVTETGEARFVSLQDGVQYTGTLQVDGDQVTGSLTALPFAGLLLLDGSSSGTIDFEGTLSGQASVAGTYTGAGDSGTFTLAYNPAYERVSDLQKVAGNWTFVGNIEFKAGLSGDPFGVIAVTVAGDGSFIGGDTDACDYQGSFGIIDSNFNLYSVDATVANCGGLDGSYSGFASLTDDAGVDDSLLIAVTSSTVSIAGVLDRITSRSAAGIWTGTQVSDSAPAMPVPLFGVIAENGASGFVDEDGAIYTGQTRISGNFLDSTFDAFAPPGSLFPDGTTSGPVTVRGLVDSRMSLGLSYFGVGDTGDIALTYDMIYERPSALDKVADTWAFDDGMGDTVDVTIAMDGTVSGADSGGCTYAGSVSLIDATYNAYQVDVDLTGCPEADSYSGVATLTDSVTAEDTLAVVISSADFGLGVSLTRVTP